MFKLSWILIACLLCTVTTRMTETGKALDEAGETQPEVMVEHEDIEQPSVEPEDTAADDIEPEDIEPTPEDTADEEEAEIEDEKIETPHEIVPVVSNNSVG